MQRNKTNAIIKLNERMDRNEASRFTLKWSACDGTQSLLILHDRFDN